MRKSNFWKKLPALALAGVMSVSLFAGGTTVFAGEEASETETEVTEEMEEAPAGTDSAQLGIKYAQNLGIEYLGDDVKLVTDGDGNELLLVPKEGEIPEGYEDKKVLRTPVEHAMYGSSSYVSYMDALGDESLYDTIAAVNVPVEDWTVPQVIERMESGQITYIAEDHWTAGNIEEITTVNPDVVLVTGGNEAAVQMCAQLDEVNIPYIIVSEWLEAESKAQLEWMKLFGAIYNQDQQANDVFEAKLAAVEELKAAAAQIPEEEKPVVAAGQIFDGIVYVPGGQSATAQEIEAAGGIYALSDLEGEGTVEINMEEFLDKAKDADILDYTFLIDYMPDKAYMAETEPLMAEFKFYQDDKIYAYAKDYYMSAAAVDEKFKDLVAIIHPELTEGYELVHYQKLPETSE